ncbi:MAG TPA: poly-beta-hydroxybutyrate polymerase [Acidimicrobiia bacterium]|nr:poly-beta-hydroxybutyrate polymerase [Acidimicrobiia bacterium]
MAADDSDNTALGELLGITEAALDTADPVSLARGYLGAMRRAAFRPWRTVPAVAKYGAGLGLTGAHLVTRALGHPLPEVVHPEPGDNRFRDPTWADNIWFHGGLASYLLTTRLIHDLVAAAQLEGSEGSKADFAASILADALSPTNFALGNPRAVKRAFETGGTSIVRGLRNFVHDVVKNEGWPSQVDSSSFVLGENTAATPGHVVFRNDLIEVLQYEPKTDEVFERPLVIIPPWINRYYIADLAPGKSLVEWAVERGHTTFAVSFRNPDSSMRDLTFDDYLRLGPLTAIDVAREITGSETVNTLSICLGGTMTVMCLAYLNACGDDLVHSATFLNCGVDYEDAGVAARVFTDPATLESLSRRMERHGYLPGKDIARTFDLLRANDLLFRYVVDGWLLGEKPPSFDLLAWNADSTNLPGKAHSEFLRKAYMENALARDEYVALGERLMVSEIGTDSYVVAGIEDHIVPWPVSYRTTQMFKGPMRFVMTSGGHIAGIVCPPSPKVRLWTNDDLPRDAAAWQAGATEHRDTWWNDWSRWLAERAGGLLERPTVGSVQHPPTGPAPGEYVRS